MTQLHLKKKYTRHSMLLHVNLCSTLKKKKHPNYESDNKEQCDFNRNQYIN